MILQVENLSFSYNRDLVLEEISFNISKGKFVGVLGGNGAGKSTLFKCILGFLDYDKGNIFIENENIKNLDLKERAKKVAYIPQSHIPSFNHQVLNVVEMGANVRLKGFGAAPGEEERKRAYEILKMLGIEELAYRGYKEISGGERQLVLIARALMQDASILMMDEPTANLDYGNQIMVLKTCKKLTEIGYTIIQSTHHPEQAFRFFDEVILIHENKILANGVTTDVLTEENLNKLYDIDLKVGIVKDNGEDEYVLIPRY